MAVPASPAPAALATAWEHALAGWDEPPRHALILALAAEHRAFAWVAARYREYLTASPGDAVATAALERINKAALATMYATATRKPESRLTRQTVMILVLGMLAVVVMLGVFLLGKIKDRDPPGVQRTPVKARRL